MPVEDLSCLALDNTRQPAHLVETLSLRLKEGQKSHGHSYGGQTCAFGLLSHATSKKCCILDNYIAQLLQRRKNIFV